MSEFGQLLHAAACEALRGRSLEIFHLRYQFLYGGSNVRAYSLEEIAEHYGMTRSRVRQALSKTFTRIRWNASRHLKRGEAGSPCARLLVYLCTTMRPHESPHAVRAYCRQFSVEDEWAVAHLVLSLAMPPGDRRRALLTSIKYLIAQPPPPTPALKSLPQASVSVTI